MAKMKDTGIEWIGEIPEEWSINKIKYEYKIQTGFTPDTSREDYYSDNGVTWISIADLTNCKNKIISESTSKISEKYIKEKHPAIVLKDSLLYSFKLSVGKVAFAAKNLYTNEAIANFKNEETNCLNYLYYASFLIEENANINIYNAKILNQELINNAIISIPGIKEQKLIAKFLDDKIEKIEEVLKDLNNQIEILNKYKKSLVTETVTKGLNLNAKMKNSAIDWIGKIPEHWNFKKLKYILKDNCVNLKVGPFGSALAGDDFKEEGYWVYNQRCVLDKNFDYTDMYVDEQKFNELKGFKVCSNDILITTRGTIGKVAVVPQNAQLGILHPCLIKFVVNNNLICNKLVELVFNESNIISEQIYRKSNATTIEVIYSYTLKDLFLPIIPMEEQKQIVSYLDKKCKEIDSLIKDKQAQIKKMEEYKKSLIYEYVTGKKRVKGAEELYG